MMVLFVSRSEKKAILTVRRILDSFADRIGTDTWKTVITEDGLLAVKLLLRKHATKNMAVACHRIRSKSRSDVMWIVGNRDKFNEQGVIPVNSTRKNIRHSEWESEWSYLPRMTPLVAMASLLHDWGKSTKEFQQKLKKNSKTGDAFRHEWISCRMVSCLLASCQDRSNDMEWLVKLSNGNLEEKFVTEMLSASSHKELEELPPIAAAVCWLVLSHHRMPSCKGEKYKGFSLVSHGARDSLQKMMRTVRSDWGYDRDTEKKVTFPKSMLSLSDPWLKQIRKWSKRILAEYDNILDMLNGEGMRLALQYMRLGMMMGDYFASAKPARPDWNSKCNLYANTDREKNPKQKLDEHLVGVAEQALKFLHRLPQFEDRMEFLYDARQIRKKSSGPYAWQNTVVEQITSRREELEQESCDSGWFVVNMASTGCGKTIANAKIMRAISRNGERLRYVLALGLRSLTLQTGEEYRSRLGLSKADMAVLVGDAASRDLNRQKQRDSSVEDDEGMEDREELLDGILDYQVEADSEFLELFFSGHLAAKNRAFLYKPVLVATIDHVVAATETVRGGKYMLPFLRLMTSDLVIDEVDDFSPTDLWAVSRLAHLAGMLGKNVAISSATIPPDLAEALFYAYQSGRNTYLRFLSRKGRTTCVWCDEFKTRTECLTHADLPSVRKEFHVLHQAFVKKRISFLGKQVIKRKACIVDCPLAGTGEASGESLFSEEEYCSRIQSAAISLHDMNCMTDRITGKKISFGVIRTANIDFCVALSKFLLEAEWKPGYDVRLMTYHSRQPMLLRHEQEGYLDAVLKRKEGWEKNVLERDGVLRRHMDGCSGKNLLFVVVATPVEEIGRDHDFHWAVVEPSSYRSLIQLAGRVLRHQTLREDIGAFNMAVMQYNLKGMQGQKQCFQRPGYETEYTLESHDIRAVMDEKELNAGIQSIPRIQKPEPLLPKKRLIDLEHQVMQDFNDASQCGPRTLHGYLEEFWWLTGMPQSFHSFRAGFPQTELYYCCGDSGSNLSFYVKDKEEFVSKSEEYHIKKDNEIHSSTNPLAASRLWIKRDYKEALERQLQKEMRDIEPVEREEKIRLLAKKYGKISVPMKYLEPGECELLYSDDFGMYRNR